MRYPTRSRQLLLTIIAVLLPAAVLVGLSRRLIRQDAELAKSRATEERRNAVEHLRRELSARLDALKLQEINRWIRIPSLGETDQPPDSALVFVAAIDGDRVIMPWESSSPPAKPSPQFATHRQHGESLEFVSKDFSGAGEAYREALRASKTTAEKCEAALMQARVLIKIQKNKEADRIYHGMLKDCDAATDQDGIPFALYAAERLIEALHNPPKAYDYLIERTTGIRWIPPYQAYMIRSMLKSAPGEEVESLRNVVGMRIAATESLQTFAKEFHRLRASAEAAWITYGPEPLLISVVQSDPPLPALAFAVSSTVASQKFLPSSATLVGTDAAGSEPLGEGFRGLAVKWKTVDPLNVRTGPGFLYLAGVAFILGVTIVSGYLLLRDVNRDLRMAELRSHFVASVSHELKTPLTAIRMFADTLVLGRAPDERTRSEYLDTIVNESERLTRLVDNVLDFSKIEQGKKIYRMQPTCLADVVRSAARAMQYPLAQQGFTLKVSMDERAGRSIPADADALEQAILNLLSNAMKYSGASRQIELRLKSHHNEAVIEVVDQGVGIDPQEQPHVFEKFYRGRSAEKDLIAGTGLGLTVVKHIIDAHRGRVEMKSAPGVGSTFSIRLPEVLA